MVGFPSSFYLTVRLMIVRDRCTLFVCFVPYVVDTGARLCCIMVAMALTTTTSTICPLYRLLLPLSIRSPLHTLRSSTTLLLPTTNPPTASCSICPFSPTSKTSVGCFNPPMSPHAIAKKILLPVCSPVCSPLPFPLPPAPLSVPPWSPRL